MNELLQMISSGAGLLSLVLIALTVVLVILLAGAGKRERTLGDRLQQIESTLSNQMSAARDAGDEQARRNREELTGNLRGMGDSVTRVMSEISRTQQAQMDAFAGQLREIGRAEEDRIAQMHRTMEKRLEDSEDRLERIGDALEDKMDRGETRIDRIREAVEQRMESLQNDNNQRLLQLQHVVDERLNTALDKRLDESFRLVSERLELVYRGLGEMQSLASGVVDLRRVLSGVKAHGLMGEIQLGALLSQMMTPEQYDQDVCFVEDGERVNFAIRLPAQEHTGEFLYLPIDAQFPHEAYYRLMDALEGGGQAQIDELSEALCQKLIAQARRISERFIVPGRTTDFAVLFLGSEGLYAEALRRPELMETLQRDYHVTLTGPSTLAALLNSLQMGFRTMALERRSEEVWALLGAVRGEFTVFAEALSRTQKRIRQASESIEDAARKSRTIQRRLKGVEQLGEEERRRYLDVDPEEEPYDGEDWD